MIFSMKNPISLYYEPKMFNRDKITSKAENSLLVNCRAVTQIKKNPCLNPLPNNNFRLFRTERVCRRTFQI